jgi:hypothetical protein
VASTQTWISSTTGTVPHPRRIPLWRRTAPVFAVLVPTLVTALHAIAYGRWIVDDAGITFAYARSVTSGAGPVLQPGGPVVEGYSDPAWLAVLGVGRLTGLFDRGAWFGVPDYVLFPKGVALLCCAGVYLAGYRIATAVSRRPALVAAAAGVAVAVSPSFVIWSFSGLENSLLALAVASLAAMLVRAAVADRLLDVRTAVACGSLAALAALTRPDGLVYAAAYPLTAALFAHRETLARTVRAAVLSLGVLAVPVGGYLVWRYATFGALLPNTALAKSQAAPAVSAVHRVTNLIGYVGWPLVLLAAGCVGAALVRPAPVRRALVVLAVPALLAVLAFVVLTPDWMTEFRFATPLWPVAAWMTVLALEAVTRRAAARGRVAVAACTVAACALTGLAWKQDIAKFRRGPTVALCGIAEQSRAYNEYGRILGEPDASILLPDIGATALTSRFRVADLAGLADRDIALFWSRRDMAGLRDYVFTRLRPTFIHTHGGWSTRSGLLADPRLRTDYTVLRQDSPTSVDLVRTDAVDRAGGARTMSALHEAVDHAVARQAAIGVAPRRSCGPRLDPSG